MEIYTKPRYFENREFVDLTEEEINRITQEEKEKLDSSEEALEAKAEVESEYGSGGTWEQYWIAIDHTGKRVFANIYYRGDIGIAVTADGNIVKAFTTD